jgi:hypothetical protein
MNITFNRYIFKLCEELVAGTCMYSTKGIKGRPAQTSV